MGGAGRKHGTKGDKYSRLVIKPEAPRTAITHGMFPVFHAPRSLTHLHTPRRPQGRRCAFKAEAPPLPAQQPARPSAPPAMTSSLPFDWLCSPSVRRCPPLAPVSFPRCSWPIGHFPCRSPAPLRSDWRARRGASGGTGGPGGFRAESGPGSSRGSSGGPRGDSGVPSEQRPGGARGERGTPGGPRERRWLIPGVPGGFGGPPWENVAPP